MSGSFVSERIHRQAGTARRIGDVHAGPVGQADSLAGGPGTSDGKVSGGLPDVDKTLNWVHLSSRFPVRIRVERPDPTLFRIGASAVTVVR